MSDSATAIASALAAVFSAMAAGLTVWATLRGPENAAKLSEDLRQSSEQQEQKRRSKLAIFATLMQNRHAYNLPDAVAAFNLIDLVFMESRPVREAWASFHESLDGKNGATDLEKKNRLRGLLTQMALDLGISGDLSHADFERIYYPNSLADERLAQTLQRQHQIRTLTAQQPTANNAPQPSQWPPPPT